MPSAGRGHRPTVAVVGAGLTGLTAAYRLVTDHPEVEVVVLEAGPRVGGLVQTAPFDHVDLDTAADAFLARVPEAVDLCRELGLADRLVHPATGSALVLTPNGLRRLPAGLVLGVPTDLDALAASGIVSHAGVERAAADLDAANDGPDASNASNDPGGAGVDCSVGDLVRRHLGDEVMDRLVAPLLGGVNAGDADALSLAAGAPQLAAVAGAPSLIGALRRQAAGGGPSGPVFAGFPTGTSTLVDALVAALPPGSLHLGTTVTSIAPRPGRGPGGGSGGGPGDGGSGYRISTSHTADTTSSVAAERSTADTLDVDAVVLAVPGHAAAPLLDGLGGVDAAATGLGELAWASVAMVSIALDTDHVEHPLDASGYLVPAALRRTVTAASFASTKWAHLHRPGRALLRVSAGHSGDETPLHLDDDELTAAVHADLAGQLGVSGPFADVRITRWWRALPQYRPGHLDRCRSWQADVWDAHPGVWPTGASFEGLGLPACVRQGTAASGRIAAHLGLPAST